MLHVFPMFLIFPHQLFENADLPNTICMIEYFSYSCKIKKLLHCASMLYYKEYLESMGHKVRYITFDNLEKFIANLEGKNVELYDPVDKSIYKLLKKTNVTYRETSYFIATTEELSKFHDIHPTANQETFYRWQRKRLNILMKDDKPIGGKFNYDKLNRENPNTVVNTNLPAIGKQSEHYYQMAEKIIEYGPNNHGDTGILYPCTHKDAKRWFKIFIRDKLSNFAKYQDVHQINNPYIYHAIITPMLNIGLLTPFAIVKYTIKYASKTNIVPVEAFIRQIIGWREYMRYQYMFSKLSLKMNFFDNQNKLKDSYYDGTTGIDCIDNIIKHVNKTGYAHHIIRLMWLGAFFQLTQTKPSLVYKWFMELFVDSYDWVMIPNVIGMSQYADGGIVATRPYFSSSVYLKKMSNIKSADFEKDSKIWNALYYNFLNDKPQLTKIYIVSNWVRSWKNKSIVEKNAILRIAEKFLKS